MSHRSQAQRILDLLIEGRNRNAIWSGSEWVTLPMILSLGIASHTRRIHELRKAGHQIEIRNQYVAGQRRTAYRLIR